MMPHIAILLHEHGSFSKHYYLYWIAQVWEEQGFEVTVAAGPKDDVHADIAVLHVDLTVVPADHLEFLERFPVVVNHQVVDISKRLIGSPLIRETDTYDGPVILKADRNWGGRREAQLAARGLGPPDDRRILREYLIYDSLADVREELRRDPLLVLEKFLPERDGDLYCLRMWKFFGDRETSVRCFSKDPVVKAANTIDREPLNDVPDELREIRSQLGFDFGKFDYGIVDGRPILYDVNRTPAIPPLPHNEVMRQVRQLAEGIRPFFK